MNSPSNPLELVQRYLQAVRFWMPKTHRQEDVLTELGEDLRSQIEEKEAELGRALDNGEVSAILKRCGSPMLVAGRLSPGRYLIGPALFPVYIFVLKMVLLWILVPVFIFIVAPTNLASDHGEWATIVANTIGQLWFGCFTAAGIITLVFAILERTHAELGVSCKWDPMKLPPVRQEERKPTVARSVCQLVFAVFGVVWLLLLPQYPVLILGPAAAMLKAAPMWHAFYFPILLLGFLAVLRPSITLAKPEWAWFPSLAELVQAVFSLILLNFIINAAGATHGGDWHPFVVAADAASNSMQYVRVAAVVNVSILVSLVCAWLGLCIALVIQVWQLIRVVRKRFMAFRHPAALQAR